VFTPYLHIVCVALSQQPRLNVVCVFFVFTALELVVELQFWYCEIVMCFCRCSLRSFDCKLHFH